MVSTQRICFVIMPFSETTSCSQEEWTEIFENIIRPAVEEAGLGYKCRRSTATRGNIVASIIRDLNDAHVVIADLTDRNANVFYELGVRHSLKNRTILLAQRMADIPSDLQTYASHVYSWTTQSGKDELTCKLGELLKDIDANPEKADNPVSDFLEVGRHNTVNFFENRNELQDIAEYVTQFEVVWAMWHTAAVADNRDIWNLRKIKKLVLIDPNSSYLGLQSSPFGRNVDEQQSIIRGATGRAQREGVDVKWFEGPIPSAITIGNPESTPIILVEPLILYTNVENRQSYQVDVRHQLALQTLIQEFNDVWTNSRIPS